MSGNPAKQLIESQIPEAFRADPVGAHIQADGRLVDYRSMADTPNYHVFRMQLKQLPDIAYMIIAIYAQQLPEDKRFWFLLETINLPDLKSNFSANSLMRFKNITDALECLPDERSQIRFFDTALGQNMGQDDPVAANKALDELIVNLKNVKLDELANHVESKKLPVCAADRFLDDHRLESADERVLQLIHEAKRGINFYESIIDAQWCQDAISENHVKQRENWLGVINSVFVRKLQYELVKKLLCSPAYKEIIQSSYANSLSIYREYIRGIENYEAQNGVSFVMIHDFNKFGTDKQENRGLRTILMHLSVCGEFGDVSVRINTASKIIASNIGQKAVKEDWTEARQLICEFLDCDIPEDTRDAAVKAIQEALPEGYQLKYTKPPKASGPQTPTV